MGPAWRGVLVKSRTGREIVGVIGDHPQLGPLKSMVEFAFPSQSAHKSG